MNIIRHTSTKQPSFYYKSVYQNHKTMKRLAIIFTLFIFLISVLLLFENCGSEEEEIPNKAPTCSITSPTNNAAIELGTIAKISISASDADGSVSNVKISIDDVSTTTLQSSPYAYDWNTSGVSPGEHNIKAVATDDGGLTATSQIIVDVIADAPTVTTADITEITGTTATSGGNVSDDGGVDVTTRGVVWGETTGPTLADKTGFTEDGTAMGAFTSSLTSLSPATTYYVKAYATNSQGTAYGEEKSFTTAGLPTVVTGDVSDITYESAVCAGEVTGDGGETVTARGVVWNNSGDPAPTLEDNEGVTTEGSGVGTFSSSMSSLDYDTRYQVKAYATNSTGTVYGDIKYFTTIPAPPSVSAVAITKIGAHVATVSGELTDDGGATKVYILVVWSTSPNPDLTNNEGQSGNYYGDKYGFTFEYLLTGLDPETKYYIKAIASNDYDDVTFGVENSFTTEAFTIQTGSFTDSRDSKQYGTVTISGQTWMAENLTYLPEVCGVDAECGYWVYDYEGTDVNTAKATANYATFGVLYNQEMAIASCPAGWHLPSSDEWSLLEINIGMEYRYAYGGLQRKNTVVGDKLKETGSTLWDDTYKGPNTGTNIAGFNARPGGYREIITNIIFQWQGIDCHFWTSTVSGNTELLVTYRHIHGSAIYKTKWGKDPYENLGMSVRCVQD